MYFFHISSIFLNLTIFLDLSSQISELINKYTYQGRDPSIFLFSLEASLPPSNALSQSFVYSANSRIFFGHGMQNLSSLTRDQTCACCSGSV